MFHLFLYLLLHFVSLAPKGKTNKAELRHFNISFKGKPLTFKYKMIFILQSCSSKFVF